MPTADLQLPNQTSSFDLDSPGIMASRAASPKLRTLAAVDGARTALAVLALCAGITVLGVSADALAVYDATHVSADYLLPLWPQGLDARPTVALVACGAITAAVNGAAVVGSRASLVSPTPCHAVCPSFPFLSFPFSACRDRTGHGWTRADFLGFFFPPFLRSAAACPSTRRCRSSRRW